jgi:hypothetical protein
MSARRPAHSSTHLLRSLARGCLCPRGIEQSPTPRCASRVVFALAVGKAKRRLPALEHCPGLSHEPALVAELDRTPDRSPKRGQGAVEQRVVGGVVGRQPEKDWAAFLVEALARSRNRCTGSAGSCRLFKCVRQRLIFNAKTKSSECSPATDRILIFRQVVEGVVDLD